MTAKPRCGNDFMSAGYKPAINIEGTFVVPEGAPRPEYVIPDEVVAFCAERYGLCLPNMRGIDPLCGTGTIPRVINERGGWCDGIELDPTHYKLATAVVPPGKRPLDNGLVVPIPASQEAGNLFQGDCTKIMPVHPATKMFYPYHYIYTSIPFDLILDKDLDGAFASTFDRLLMPGGYLFIDSADEAVRHGTICNPADATIAYFRRYGFELRDRMLFYASALPEGCDNQFTELLFTRAHESWLYDEAQSC